MGQAELIQIARYLAQPGVQAAARDVELSLTAEGVSTQNLNEPARNGLLALAPPVNAHDHGYGIRTLDFGCYDDALEPWIAGLRNRPHTDPYLEALVAFGRLARNGCGATMHCQNSLRADRLADEVAAVARAARDSGIRVALSCPLLDDSAWVYGGPDQLRALVSEDQWPAFERRMPHYAPFKEQLAAAEDCIKRYRHNQFDERFDVQLGPIGPQWCSDAMLEAIAETSERLNCRIHMHLLESPRQRVWLDQRFPGGVVAFLDSIGFLSPRLAVAHGVQLRPAECELLAERGVIVASNPSANLRLRSGIAPVESYREAGLAYAIGMDGTSFSDDQDIWEEMRLFHLLHGGQGLDPAIEPAELFQAVTQTGAKLLGLPTSGDLVTINFDAMMAECLEEVRDEALAILTRMTRHFVSDLYVGGKQVVQGGNVISFDYEAALGELVAQARHASGQKDNEERAFVGTLASAIRQHYAKLV